MQSTARDAHHVLLVTIPIAAASHHHPLHTGMTPTFLPELQESFGDDDESESYSASSSLSPQSSSPRSSFSSSIRGSSTTHEPDHHHHHHHHHHRPEGLSSCTKVLIIGATSENGHEIIRQLYDHPSRPEIHAFVDESTTGVDEDDSSASCPPPAFPKDLQVKCTSIVEGSVRHAIDLEEAIANTNVNWVVLCGPPLGNHHRHRRHRESRTMAAKNLATALMSRPGFDHVRVMIVSRVGTKQCPLRSQSSHHRGVGGMLSLSATVSSLLQWNQHDREEILDCSGQEEALSQFLRSNNNNNDNDGIVYERRLTIIRSNSVVSSSTTRQKRRRPPLQNLVELTTRSATTLPGDGNSSSLRYTHRHDLASGVVDELCNNNHRICRTLYFASRP